MTTETDAMERMAAILEGSPLDSAVGAAAFMTGIDSGLRIGLTKPRLAEKMLAVMRTLTGDHAVAIGNYDNRAEAMAKWASEENDYVAGLEKVFGREEGAA